MEGGAGRGEGGGAVEICHVPANSPVFKQQIYYSFLQIESVGGQKIGHILWTSYVYAPLVSFFQVLKFFSLVFTSVWCLLL